MLFSVQALQSLMDVEYHKMIRNTAKIESRKNRKHAAEKTELRARKTNDDEDNDNVSEEGRSEASWRSGRGASISGASLKSFVSALSSSKRVHVAKYYSTVYYLLRRLRLNIIKRLDETSLFGHSLLNGTISTRKVIMFVLNLFSQTIENISSLASL